MSHYLWTGDAKEATHFGLYGHKLKVPLDTYKTSFLPSYLMHIQEKPDKHHIAITERNNVHPDGYTFYLDVDLKSDDDWGISDIPKIVNDFVDHLRKSVIGYVIKHKVDTLCGMPIYDEIMKDLQHMHHILKHHRVAVHFNQVRQLLDHASSLWENMQVAMKPNCAHKLHLHFTGLVVDHSGAKEIFNKAVKTPASRKLFGETIYNALDPTCHEPHQLRMLGSHKGPLDKIPYFACRMLSGNIMFLNVTQPMLKPLMLDDLIKYSVFPLSETLIDFKNRANEFKFIRKRKRIASSCIDSADEDDM